MLGRKEESAFGLPHPSNTACRSSSHKGSEYIFLFPPQEVGTSFVTQPSLSVLHTVHWLPHRVLYLENSYEDINEILYRPSIVPGGGAEQVWFVQTFKQAMKASEKDGHSVSHRLANFLMTYRTTPHSTTNVAPCTLFLQREIRTWFNLLQPDPARRVCLNK